jgi:hypothetical protein
LQETVQTPRKHLQIKTDLLSSRVPSQLTISEVAMNDSGEYLCLAENSAGQAKKTLLLTVQVTGNNYPSSSLTRLDDQDVPSKITHMEVLDYTSRAANLSWTPPYDGQSPITSYNIRYKPYQGDDILYPTPYHERIQAAGEDKQRARSRFMDQLLKQS